MVSIKLADVLIAEGKEIPDGLLVLGSPDATRYTADMGVDFLLQVGDIASAALARLLSA